LSLERAIYEKEKNNVDAHNEPAGLFSSSKTRERSFFVLCTHEAQKFTLTKEKDVDAGLELRRSRNYAIALCTIL